MEKVQEPAPVPSATRAFPREPSAWRDRRVEGLLAGGFVLTMLLIGADGVIGFRSILSIRENVSQLTRNQFRNVALIDEVQRMQLSLSAVVQRLSLGEARRDRDQLERGVNNIEQSFQDLFAGIPKDDPDIELWRAVERAAIEATLAADRVLELDSRRQPDVTAVLAARDHLIASTTALIRANHERAEATGREIEAIASRQLRKDAALLGASLLLAALCAWLVISSAARLQRQVTEQAAELGSVSWQLLERQENLARRLSHELHDELGQSLTALKTNFARFTHPGAVDAAWVEDCSDLLRDSIRSAHEISQLLRPTILDDFGLDSALAWLCERFEERNRVEVTYESDLPGRLDPQTETHVFRIAQEALTNITKHARATRVSMMLRQDGASIRFRVVDNGIGFSGRADAARPQFGVTGMKARARSLEGTMLIGQANGGGTKVEVVFPWKAKVHEEEDPHLVG